MTTIHTEEAEPFLTECPPWCTLTPGHDWDTIALDASDNLMRGHQGPSFGPLTCEGLEVSDGRPLRLTVLGPEERESEFETAASLLDLAASAVAAAEWLEAHR